MRSQDPGFALLWIVRQQIRSVGVKHQWLPGTHACIKQPAGPACHTQAGPAGPVILAYSTAARAGEAAAWRAAGADACVSKPARTRSLLQRLRALKARRSRD